MIELGNSGPLGEQAVARVLKNPAAERAEKMAPELLHLAHAAQLRAEDDLSAHENAASLGATDVLETLRDRLRELRAAGFPRGWQDSAQREMDWIAGASPIAPWQAGSVAAAPLGSRLTPQSAAGLAGFASIGAGDSSAEHESSPSMGAPAPSPLTSPAVTEEADIARAAALAGLGEETLPAQDAVASLDGEGQPEAADLDAESTAAKILEKSRKARAVWSTAPAWSIDWAWGWSLGGRDEMDDNERARWALAFDKMGAAGRSLWVAWLRGFAQGGVNPAQLGAWGSVGQAFARALPPGSFGQFNPGFLALRLLPFWAALPNITPRDASQIKAANAWMAVCANLLASEATVGERARDILGLAEAVSRGESGLPLASRFGRLTQAFWPKFWMDSSWGPNLARFGAAATLIWAFFAHGWVWGLPVALFIVFWALQSWRMARALWIGRPGWEKGWPARAVEAAWKPMWKDPESVSGAGYPQ